MHDRGCEASTSKKLWKKRGYELKTQTRGPAEAGPRCPDLRLRFAALLSADLFRRHRVCEEILVLRFETVRKAENVKAVAIADCPELHLG